jgi:hypothetical protein
VRAGQAQPPVLAPYASQRMLAGQLLARQAAVALDTALLAHTPCMSNTLLPRNLNGDQSQPKSPAFLWLSPAAIFGMVVNNNAATPLVSFGTLCALWLVVNAMLYRRYIPDVHVRVTRCGQPCICCCCNVSVASAGHVADAA